MKVVFIKILQVLWVLSIVITIAGVIAALVGTETTYNFMVNAAIGVSVAFGFWVILIVIQYLVFGKLNPMRLFNVSLLEKRYLK